jgi:alpha-tubulin suppressor-like RCC1 family protein
MALDTKGRVYTWGENTYGQLGFEILNPHYEEPGKKKDVE